MKDFKKASVLVVDDYEINLHLLALSLKSLGNIASLERNGKDAVNSYKNKPSDLILLDLMMPIMDGYEVAKLIRAFEKENGLIPSIIVAVSANSITGSNDKIYKSGFDEILSKPFLISDLKKILSKYFTILE